MNEGFSLVEFLIYIGIVAVALTVIGNFAFHTIWGKARVASMDEVSQNARFALDRIALAVRNAQAINSPAPGTSAPALSLETLDPLDNPTVFDLSSSVLRITEATDPPVNLTSSIVAVTSLQFSNVSYPATPGTIRVSITVRFNNQSNREEFNFQETFHNTANVRRR